jgi:hypothetical protein
MAGQRRSQDPGERPVRVDGTGGLAVVWRKSTHSNHQSACVEVGIFSPEMAGFRDSKDPEGAVLTFTRGEFRAFVAAVADGEFPGGQ